MKANELNPNVSYDDIKLQMIAYNESARNGVWCTHPYPGHKTGCPNFKKGCTSCRPDFKNIAEMYNWYAVMEVFDLKSHAEKMRSRLPWTERQCRNPLYRQPAVRKKLRQKAEALAAKYSPQSIILDIPEACGVEVFETMSLVGYELDRHPDIVVKVMLVGIPRIFGGKNGDPF